VWVDTAWASGGMVRGTRLVMVGMTLEDNGDERRELKEEG
jgi:hypothetical protein